MRPPPAWNQLSAQKAVESILPHSNYYICLGNNSIVLIMRKGYDPSIIKELSMLFNDVSFAIGRTGPNLNEAFVSAQNTMFAGKRLYPESMIYDYRDFEFAYAISGASGGSIRAETRSGRLRSDKNQ